MQINHLKLIIVWLNNCIVADIDILVEISNSLFNEPFRITFLLHLNFKGNTGLGCY